MFKDTSAACVVLQDAFQQIAFLGVRAFTTQKYLSQPLFLVLLHSLSLSSYPYLCLYKSTCRSLSLSLCAPILFS